MQEVEFYYPDELLGTMKKAEEAAAQAQAKAAVEPTLTRRARSFR